MQWNDYVARPVLRQHLMMISKEWMGLFLHWHCQCKNSLNPKDWNSTFILPCGRNFLPGNSSNGGGVIPDPSSHSSSLHGWCMAHSVSPSERGKGPYNEPRSIWKWASVTFYTVLVLRIAHRKWKETNQQPSMLPGPAVPGCCSVSFHILWAILSMSTVVLLHFWAGFKRRN